MYERKLLKKKRRGRNPGIGNVGWSNGDPGVGTAGQGGVQLPFCQARFKIIL
jgi:hypothetical protein